MLRVFGSSRAGIPAACITGSAHGEAWFLNHAETRGSFILTLLNSHVFHAYARRVFVDKQGGWFEVQPKGLEEFPIPSATPEERGMCGLLMEGLLALHGPEGRGHGERELMVAYLEQWLNGLVYELYFPGPLHARNIRVFEASMAVGLPAPGGPDYLGALHAAFRRAHALEIGRAHV